MSTSILFQNKMSKNKELNWKEDPCRETLKEDILSGAIPPGMKPKDAQNVRQEYLKMTAKLFAGRLTGMRKMIAKNGGGEEKKKKEEKWNKKNLVRQQLKKDLAAGFIKITDDAKTAWTSRAVYAAIKPFELWKSRYNGMVKIVQEGMERAAEDANDLYHDRLLHPRPTHNKTGQPEWIEHEAKELLEYDMDDNKHKEMSPQELYNSRLQYQDFSLEVFRGHIYQEEQTRKWRKQWVDGKKEYALVEFGSQ